MVWIIQDAEAGNRIDEANTLEEAKQMVEDYEQQDKKDGTYTPDFYEIIKIEIE